MMTTTRRASTTWHGTLFEGAGETTFLSSGIGTFAVSWPSRSAEPDGQTSPEELIAAAHASCFSMALANALATNETPATSLTTSVEVDFTPGTGITAIRIAVAGEVPGLDDAGFATIAHDAKENCPVSRALAAVPITLRVD